MEMVLEIMKNAGGMTIMLAFLLVGIFLTFVSPALMYQDWKKNKETVTEGRAMALYLVLSIVVIIPLLFISANYFGATKTDWMFVAKGWTYAVVMMSLGMLVLIYGCYAYILGTAVARYGVLLRGTSAIASMTIMSTTAVVVYALFIKTGAFVLYSLSMQGPLDPGDVFRMMVVNYDLKKTVFGGQFILLSVVMLFISSMLVLPSETRRGAGLPE
jgi:hypothetical protein